MSQKSETTSKLDRLNEKYEALSSQKNQINKDIERVRKDIADKEQLIDDSQSAMIRQRSDQQETSSSALVKKSKGGGSSTNTQIVVRSSEQQQNQQQQGEVLSKNEIKDLKNGVDELQSVLSSLIQKGKATGRKIEDIELEMLDVASKSDVNKK